MKVLIKRGVTSHDIVEISVSQISGVRWDNISGGVYARQAGYSLYGYVDYDIISEMGLNSGAHAKYNGQNKVMIPASLKKNNHIWKGISIWRNWLEKSPRLVITRGKWHAPNEY